MVPLAEAGTTFSVALYFAPVDPANPFVQPATSAFTQQGASTYVGILVNGTYRLPGIYNGGTVLVPGISPPGGLGWFQVRAWLTAFGSTYEQALASENAQHYGLTGESNLIVVRTSDPTTGASPAALLGLSGITFFVDPPLPCVPEPSACLLGLVAAAGLSLAGWKSRSAYPPDH
jgi:hypothetical protein